MVAARWRFLSSEVFLKDGFNPKIQQISKLEINDKMKFPTIFFAGITSAAAQGPLDPASEADDTAIVSLNNLVNISSEILASDSVNRSFRWKNKWTRKFQFNSERMRRSFYACGTKYGEVDDKIDLEYDTGNPCGAIKELLNGYSNWTARYISACRGQKKNSHQQNRFEKWNNMLDKGKGLNLSKIVRNQ